MVLIHHDEIKFQELSVVDAKVEELLVFGILRQTGRKLPTMSIHHHGNRKGLAHLLTFDHRAELPLRTMDHDAGSFDPGVVVDLDRDDVLDLAFLHVYDPEHTLADPALDNMFVCEPEDALQLLGAFSYLVVRHAGNTKSQPLTLDVG